MVHQGVVCTQFCYFRVFSVLLGFDPWHPKYMYGFLKQLIVSNCSNITSIHVQYNIIILVSHISPFGGQAIAYTTVTNTTIARRIICVHTTKYLKKRVADDNTCQVRCTSIYIMYWNIMYASYSIPFL